MKNIYALLITFIVALFLIVGVEVILMGVIIIKDAQHMAVERNR